MLLVIGNNAVDISCFAQYIAPRRIAAENMNRALKMLYLTSDKYRAKRYQSNDWGSRIPGELGERKWWAWLNATLWGGVKPPGPTPATGAS